MSSRKKDVGVDELPQEPKIEEPIVEGPKTESASDSLGVLGVNNIKILKIESVVINGYSYNKLTLANGTTELLNDSDLLKQRHE